MIVAVIAVVLLVGSILVWLLISKATALEHVTTELRRELTQFKEGDFRSLVKDELQQLTTAAKDKLDQSKELFERTRTQLLEQQQQATATTGNIHTKIGEVATQLQGLRDLSTKVGELGDLLKPQQLRGELGEVVVRNLISDKLPQSLYEEDHCFSDGKKVEFVIRLNSKLVPIDSKLQLEDFRRIRESEEANRPAMRAQFKRAVKQKIDEVKQYIKPTENTYNFALMVIPSEAVFYELIGSQDFVQEGGLYDYARSQNVFLVSPLTFWAYLESISQGLRGLEIEKRAEEILSGLQSLVVSIRDFSSSEFRVLGEQLRNANNNYVEAKSKLDEIQQDVSFLQKIDVRSDVKEGVPA